ncbi:MAG: aldo/keto reductase [Hyphomicrobiaceae bacterium]|nr:aldo/keto reductase [Hyphomicrobiaceae bacterium]
MKTRRLGKTGFDISEIGLGCWQLGGDFGPLGDDLAHSILEDARDSGITFWDTADVYGGGLSESRIGAILPDAGGTVVATKVGRNASLYPDTYSRAGVRESLENSAKRLRVDAIDLAQLHCVPRTVLEDGEIFVWMDDLKKDGLIRNWGASVETVAEGLLCLKQPGLATLQIIFNIFRQDAVEKLLPAAQKADVGIIVRLPLASGLLAGKFGKGHTFDPSDHRNYNRDGEAFSVGETFSGIPFATGVDLAAELRHFVPDNTPMSRFALRWILDHPAVSTVIAGVSKQAQLAENVAASRMVPLSQADHINLERFYREKVRPEVRGEI